MEIYKNYLENFMYIHQKLRTIYIKELESLPKGKLIGYFSNGKYQYYHSETINGKYIRHGIGKDQYKKKQLARKEYLLKVVFTFPLPQTCSPRPRRSSGTSSR